MSPRSPGIITSACLYFARQTTAYLSLVWGRKCHNCDSRLASLLWLWLPVAILWMQNNPHLFSHFLVLSALQGLSNSLTLTVSVWMQVPAAHAGGAQMISLLSHPDADVSSNARAALLHMAEHPSARLSLQPQLLPEDRETILGSLPLLPADYRYTVLASASSALAWGQTALFFWFVDRFVEMRVWGCLAVL